MPAQHAHARIRDTLWWTPFRITAVRPGILKTLGCSGEYLSFFTVTSSCREFSVTESDDQKIGYDPGEMAFLVRTFELAAVHDGFRDFRVSGWIWPLLLILASW